MTLPIIKRIVMFVPDKLISINKNVNKIINFPETADKTYTYTIKIVGATTGNASAAKGSVDFLEVIPC
jgi:hypothetical protein